MSNPIRTDFDAVMLFPPAVEDWVDETHPARFIREFVRSLNLADLGFVVRERGAGRPHFSNELLLMVWLYGLLFRLSSTRKLEIACREHMSLVWMTGGKAPDHNTLWRFLASNNEALKGVFKQSTRTALKAGMVNCLLVAVDGSKIRGRGSDDKMLSTEEAKELLDHLDRRIEEFYEEVQAADESESGEYKLPEELTDAQVLRDRVRRALEEVQEESKNKVHLTDPESRMQKGRDGCHFGYNGQVAVDVTSGIIVGQAMVTDQSDSKLLTRMIKETIETTEGSPGEVLADAGYCSGEQLLSAEQEGVDVLVNLPRNVDPPPGTKPFHVSKFTHHADRDVMTCPQGEALRFIGTKKRRRGVGIERQYKCENQQCPVKHLCTTGKARRVAWSEYEAATTRQREKQRDPTAKARLGLRRLVEHTFGHIKGNRGFRRLSWWGTSGAELQWTLECTSVNLEKLYQWWASGDLALG